MTCAHAEVFVTVDPCGEQLTVGCGGAASCGRRLTISQRQFAERCIEAGLYRWPDDLVFAFARWALDQPESAVALVDPRSLPA